MASQLILAAPRPIKAIHLPFFLRNALSPCSPVSPSAALVVGAANVRRPSSTSSSSHGATHLYDQKQGPAITADLPESTTFYTHNILPNSVESEPSIEQLTARIRLTDDSVFDDPLSPGARSSSRPTMSPFGYEKATQTPSVPPRSPEGAVLEEFLNILRPVIRTPSSPIARSTRLVPRSRRSHQTLHLGPSSDRHHPYARTAKSTSPLESSSESHTEITIGKSPSFVVGGSSSKRSSGRSSASYAARRRSSNANESSSHSHSAGSSRSRSLSRRGSEGSLNYYHTNGRRAVSPSIDSPVPMEINLSIDTIPSSDPSDASLLHLSGVSPHSASPAAMD